MPRHARQLAESCLYHVMLRGVNREALFLEDEDFSQFLQALGVVRQASGARVLAYCLMTNHVHLVLRTTDEPVGAVVKRLGVRYAGWFNRKYDRVGHLFQDRFASRPVEDDAYLATLLRYVWRNPVAAGLCDRAEAYPWSSFRLLSVPNGLVDEPELRRLVDVEALILDDAVPLPPAVNESRRGRPPRFSDEEAALLSRRASGVETMDDFPGLDVPTQRRAISELRSRGMSCEQIARVTGLSPSAVRRRQVGDVSDPGRDLGVH